MTRNSPSTGCSNEPDAILVEITETLDACGIEDDTYQLYEYVDAEALEQLLASVDGDIAVQVTVEGIRLEVSPEGVDVLVEDHADSAGE
ncbi:hypothetical protein [Haloplanus halophilus]|uniref:hypothetical protein n=1 Tax=Haloplanus halophilus TaxID=2949993 RepID=UPI00203B27F3|nr:hypothetical protein [Haloplanus sp. GDY1]